MAKYQYLDINGLSTYDGLVKDLMSQEDAKAIKHVAIDGQHLYFYKVTNPASGTEADFDITLPEQDLSDLLHKITGATNGNFVSVKTDGTIEDSGKKAADFADADDLGDISNLTTTTKTSMVAAANELKTSIDNVLGTSNDGSSATTVYGARALANEKVASITAGGGIVVSTASPDSSTAPKVGIKLSTKAGNDLSIETGSGEEGLYFHQAAAPTVSVAEKSTPSTGYLKTYQVTVDGTAVGVDIDIPKDFLVKSATSGVVTAADKEAGGKFADDSSYAIGDAYLDFVINVKSGTATDEHVYVNVKNLVDVYTATATGGLDLTNNAFSIKIDSSNARGLSTGANGLALALATPDTYTSGTKTADGTAGAMSSADKYKLDNAVVEADIEAIPDSSIQALFS